MWYSLDPILIHLYVKLTSNWFRQQLNSNHKQEGGNDTLPYMGGIVGMVHH